MSAKPNLDEITLFAVRNKEGLFFRAKGYGGYGDTWVDGLRQARIYNKIGPARATVSFFANKYPSYGVPDIVQFIVTDVVILDEKSRIEKKKQKEEEAEARYKERQAQHELEMAEQALAIAQARLIVAKKGKKP